MTFTELQTDIASRLGLESDEALERIGRAINRHNRRISASTNLTATRRNEVVESATVDAAEVTFSGVEKLLNLWHYAGGGRVDMTEVTPAALRAFGDPVAGVPTHYAITHTTSNSVTVTLNALPDDVFDLFADAVTTLADLSGVANPVIAESYHDAIAEAVMADELYKQEKPKLAERAERRSEGLIAELRHFMAKSATLTLRQGDLAPARPFGGGGGGSAQSASTMTFLQSGTGAVQRTVTSRLRETLSAEDFGAVGDGTTDDTAAIQAALDEAASRGGGVVYALKAEYGISEDIVVPPDVSLVGGGLTKFIAIEDNFTRAMVVVGAYIAPGGVWTSEGPEGNRFGALQNIYIDGNDIADRGLYVGGAVQRVFINVNVRHCLNQGAVVDGAQNNFFFALHCEKNGSDPPAADDANLVLDRGAGNNVFVASELSADPSSDRGKYNLLIRQSAGSPAGVFARPSQNRFLGGVFERGGDQYGACVYHRAGYLNTFYGVDISVSGVTPAIPAVVCDNADAVGSYLTVWDSCVFSGDLGSTAFEATNSADHRFNNPTLIGFDIGWELDDNSTVYVAGRLHEGSVTTRAAKSGGSTGLARLFFYNSGEWTTPTFAAGDFTGAGDVTWTVGSGDIVTHHYRVNGETAHFAIDVNDTTVAATTGTTLQIALPDGLVAAKWRYGTVHYFADDGTRAAADCWVEPAGTVLKIRRQDVAALTPSTNNTDLKASIEFEVQ